MEWLKPLLVYFENFSPRSVAARTAFMSAARNPIFSSSCIPAMVVPAWNPPHWYPHVSQICKMVSSWVLRIAPYFCFKVKLERIERQPDNRIMQFSKLQTWTRGNAILKKGGKRVQKTKLRSKHKTEDWCDNSDDNLHFPLKQKHKNVLNSMKNSIDYSSRGLLFRASGLVLQPTANPESKEDIQRLSECPNSYTMHIF